MPDIKNNFLIYKEFLNISFFKNILYNYIFIIENGSYELSENGFNPSSVYKVINGT